MGKRLIQGVVLPAALVALWWAVTEAGVANQTILPGPGKVGAALWQLLLEGRLREHLQVSLGRVSGGFLAALALGLPAGLAVGAWPAVQRLLGPLLHFLRQIPPLAWIPVFILWFGIGEMSKLAVIAYAAFFPIFLNTAAGVANVRPDYLQMGRMLEFSWARSFRHIVWPAALPSIVAGVRLGLGNSWRALVVAEMIAAASGLGFLIMESRQRINTPEMFAGLLVIGLVGLLLDYLLVRARNRLLSWREEP